LLASAYPKIKIIIKHLEYIIKIKCYPCSIAQACEKSQAEK